MYAWLWRHLPGDRLQRTGLVLAALVVLGVLLWYFLFPWVEPKLQFDHGTVGGGASAPASPGP
ncbi:hypothetical protein [Actinoallomurus acaciae]|uniref:Uncharacterized protein n=1 Tax=Actinoallomurus acaciae TaxID=502577 RepID=A0ABV5YA13_9ACTN